MGNYRFKLSDMMPNVWFKKLRNMSRVRNHHNSPPSKKKKQQTSASATQPSKPKQSHQYDPRKSYYFSRDQLNPSDGYHISPTNPKSSEKLFSDAPRKSSKQRVNKRTSRSSPKLVTSVSADCRCRAGAVVESVCTKSDSPPEFSSSPFGSSPETDILEPEFRSDGILATESCDGLVSWSSTYGQKAMSKADDIVIEVVNKPFSATFEKPDGFDNSLSELQLPPIITKTEKSNDLKKTETKEPTKYGRRNSAKLEESRITMKEQRTSPSKRFSGTSPGVKLRINSPRIASTRKSIQTHNRRSFMSTSRKSFSDSFAVVKSSSDPQRDFRDSMVEMIVEKNIKSSKDLEDLLVCYLSLNSDEYHDLIIEVFKQIWFDLTDRPK